MASALPSTSAGTERVQRGQLEPGSSERRSPIVPTSGLFRPEGRPAWSATGFAGTRSEQSGSSADAAAHHVGVNDRAHDQTEHDRMQLLSLMLVGFVGCPRRVRPIDRATAPAATRPRDPYSLYLTASNCSDLLASVALAGWAASGTGRNNHDLGTIGVVPMSEQRRICRRLPTRSTVPDRRFCALPLWSWRRCSVGRRSRDRYQGHCLARTTRCHDWLAASQYVARSRATATGASPTRLRQLFLPWPRVGAPPDGGRPAGCHPM